MKTSVLRYYDSLAEMYDQNRFANSYGQYIDRQERNFLTDFFKDRKYSKVLDLGCGTGRLLNFATHGTDFSEEMLHIARQKYPHKKLEKGEISKIPFTDEFDCIFCLHVIMHQNKKETEAFLDECYSKLNKKGTLIFDYPTKKRRKVVSSQEDWHAENRFTPKEISKLSEKRWKIKNTIGILLFPIHRIPNGLRKHFLPLDILLCKTFLKNWASYQIVILEKI
ncbi:MULTISPECIES: class I SAM-dependent DNA methyltransferase [Chryseobacterium]|uniref:Ubiquinone/menaquinone biosynthesis C-methylase UbiE n=1 Tax=Chryseobacterium camelliae TaxID=1265445 RepID=A0ABU0TKI3_9FLAO|nr:MULTISPECIES: class I SAM-dependent methyltransferase [Chryseobacterium]MDT3408591.1 ubiquinone/menaquinone biosynthesis C-methylase UbiE [Pseudacidovorax intermedius]MDQ1097554.1 ubiquinone/menaquinone biosynthesis C-methylase UbiE [Chryseobacterium camelliae]MDQ1101483.1 ubiquinone/menaquinone biosynthesis C-methylase UbiE [Chryseobacterium sp. SORGH_AS_1048]MDR6084926.1 ubiquinone/menaquinone biosynthesis C-methylase UbiE [Chryseobacterium sp. SORGH_AS_0909]MDR6129279.1 ubiquinone/menaqu